MGAPGSEFQVVGVRGNTRSRNRGAKLAIVVSTDGAPAPRDAKTQALSNCPAKSHAVLAADCDEDQ